MTKYSDDPHEDIFMHLAICVRQLSKSYPKNDIYNIMTEISNNKTDNKQDWNEPLIY